MNLSRFANKKIALLGIGIENISVAKFFVAHKINFTILDKMPIEKLSKEAQEIIRDNELEIRTGEDYLSNLKDFDLVARTPGIPYLTLEIQVAKSSGVEITSSTKLFFEMSPAKIIGVTGTKGKGTTASIIYRIIERNFQETRNNNQANLKSQIINPKSYLIGNIGAPSFDIIEKVKSDDLIVFELSSFQLQDLEISPHIAVVTNLDNDHLDHHQSLEEYRSAKQSIIKYQKVGDFAILNKDYQEAYRLKDLGDGKKVFFSSKEIINNGAFVDKNGDVKNTVEGDELICHQNEVKLIGRHNLENIAVASIVGKILNIPTETIRSVVTSFDGLPHRLEFVKEINNVKYYNDSFSTNPIPTIAAIKSFSMPVTLILGGSEKGADFSELAKEIEKSTVSNVILIGIEGSNIKNSLKNFAGKVKIIDGEKTINEIVNQAQKVTDHNGIVLFSPACASFDMFKNYKDRGEKFKAEVLKLQ